jgi:hypothetical protein
VNVGTYNLCINQYATYVMTFVWSAGTCCGQGTAGASMGPVNLTGYTVMMQIRPFPQSAVINYDASSNIVLGGAAGTIALTIPASATTNFTWWNGVYDLVLTDPNGIVTRLLQGSVTVKPGVTP